MGTTPVAHSLGHSLRSDLIAFYAEDGRLEIINDADGFSWFP